VTPTREGRVRGSWNGVGGGRGARDLAATLKWAISLAICTNKSIQFSRTVIILFIF